MNRKKSKKWSIVIFITLFFIPSLYFTSIYFFYKRPYQALIFYLIFNKKEKYAKSIKNNKIIFSGGSNVMYGIRAKLIEKTFNIPSVNLGIQADLSIDYIIHFVKRNVRQGDIVILPLEYVHYHYSNQTYRPIRAEYIRTHDIPYFRSQNILHQFRDIKQTSLLDILSSIKEQLNFIKDKENLIKRRLYVVNKIYNKNGDVLNNKKSRKIKTYEKNFAPENITNYFKETDGLRILKSFNIWCKKNGIHLYITYPNLLYNERYRNKRFRRFFKSLNHYFKFNKIEVIGNPHDFMYKRKLFFDSKWHLTYEGVTMRTKQFIELMKKQKIPQLIKQ